ncbi:MAG: hypothetical protein TREMPRED_002390 [Tremellales sp. Tagirdzhanova-0007]|nr:MAG: hypothetical protein TREMPRED_002390 [Tremellales sp. Tagirdzhanova-0007]
MRISMLRTFVLSNGSLPSLTSIVTAACTPNTTNTAGLQSLLQAGGAGYVLSLCPGQVYDLTNTINYTAANQEISTENYPTDSTRATLFLAGTNVTGAVSGIAAGLNGCKLRNIQIDGNRRDLPIDPQGNANVDMGGANADQLIEYVHSFDPKAEGPFQCINTTVQNNDIGPCGSSTFQSWADGISLSCQQSLVQNNIITDATDGGLSENIQTLACEVTLIQYHLAAGIVIFGSPFSTVRNNTIRVQTRTMLGGINMVDVLPWLPQGNFSHTLVENNFIHGGYATEYGNATMGTNNASAIIKVGIAIGPRVWFDDQYGTNQSMGGTVQNNVFSGAFSFGMGVSSARNFVIQNNSFAGNVSFLGTYGPNCTDGALTPNLPLPLLLDPSTTSNLTVSVPMSSAPLQGAFANGTAYGLTCFLPLGTDQLAWPYGGGQVNAASTTTTGSSSPGGSSPSSTSVLGTASATGSATGSATTSARPNGKVGAAGQRADTSHAGLLNGVVLVMIGCLISRTIV